MVKALVREYTDGKQKVIAIGNVDVISKAKGKLDAHRGRNGGKKYAGNYCYKIMHVKTCAQFEEKIINDVVKEV